MNGGRTGYFDGRVYYYQRTLKLDPTWRDLRLVLKLEAVFSKSFVYVNGSQVGTGDFGYASPYCDVTDYVRFDAPNTLLVVCKTDLLFSRLWLEDAAGTRLLGTGQEVDVTREGWELIAAGSEGTSTEGAFASPVVRSKGQGALAIYRRA